MPELDRIDSHNARQLDLAAETLISLGKRAIMEKPFGRLVVTLDWKAGVFSRLETTEVQSQLLVPITP